MLCSLHTQVVALIEPPPSPPAGPDFLSLDGIDLHRLNGLTTAQKEVIHHGRQNKHILIIGAPGGCQPSFPSPLSSMCAILGAGKSHVCKLLVDIKRANGRRVKIIAPTGAAAAAFGLGATTLHYFARQGKFDEPAEYYLAHPGTTLHHPPARARALPSSGLISAYDLSM